MRRPQPQPQDLVPLAEIEQEPEPGLAELAVEVVLRPPRGLGRLRRRRGPRSTRARRRRRTDRSRRRTPVGSRWAGSRPRRVRRARRGSRAGPPTSSLPIHRPSVIAAIASPTTTSGTPIQVNRSAERPSSDASTGSVSTERASASAKARASGNRRSGSGSSARARTRSSVRGRSGRTARAEVRPRGGSPVRSSKSSDAIGVDVGARVGFGPGELLGGQMLVAEQRRGLARPARGDGRADPEVDQAHPPVLADDHVVGVEREMQDPAVVRLARAHRGRPHRSERPPTAMRGPLDRGVRAGTSRARTRGRGR